MSAADEPEPGTKQRLLKSFSDELREKNPGDAVGRGIAAKVVIDRKRERHPLVSQDQWNLLFGRRT